MVKSLEPLKTLGTGAWKERATIISLLAAGFTGLSYCHSCNHDKKSEQATDTNTSITVSEHREKLRGYLTTRTSCDDRDLCPYERPISLRVNDFKEYVKRTRELHEQNLSDLYVSGFHLDDGYFKEINLDGLHMSDCHFHNTDFGPTSVMSDMKIVGSDFDSDPDNKATLNFVDFQGSRLREVDFTNAKLHNAVFRGAVLDDVDFIGAELNNAVFKSKRTMLNNVKFTGEADLAGAEFAGAEFYDDVDFTGAKNLTQDQLDKACRHGKVKLPEPQPPEEELHIKKCKKERDFETEAEKRGFSFKNDR